MEIFVFIHNQDFGDNVKRKCLGWGEQKCRIQGV